jgi:CMP-N-acetylneuraminic acid synthetase
MKVVSMSPLKLNNERLPGKNTKKFDDGTPLCNLVFKTISELDCIDEKYCFCSDEKIIPYLPDNIKFLKRPKYLDTAEANGGDILKSFMEKVDADVYVVIHVTSPFIRGETIRKCIAAVTSGKHDSAITASDIADFLWSPNGPVNFDPSNIARSQDLKGLIKETCAVYAFTKELFVKTNRRVGFNPHFEKVGPIEAIDIDDSEDFFIANAVYMSKLRGKSAD